MQLLYLKKTEENSKIYSKLNCIPRKKTVT